tara:strand:- start:322 stop:534 length:213 start_codon:yes stop_codon:yes gene_type:complete
MNLEIKDYQVIKAVCELAQKESDLTLEQSAAIFATYRKVNEKIQALEKEQEENVFLAKVDSLKKKDEHSK